MVDNVTWEGGAMSSDASRLVVDDATARLILVGTVSGRDVDSLRAQVSSDLRPPVGRFVIDLSGCQFLEPVAVDLIGTAMGTADERSIPMTLEGASANVRLILGIAGLLDFPTTRGDGAP